MKAGKVKGLRPRTALRPNAARILEVRLGDLEDLAAAALEPGAGEARHDMRIAAKRLRYVLDLVGSCFGEEGDRAREAAREVQTILGDLRDCEAMAARAEGIVSLEELLRSRQELLVDRFRKHWDERSTREAFDGLRRALS